MAPAILGRASGAIAGGTWSPLPLAALLLLLLLATPAPAPPRWRLARGLPGAGARRGEGLANAGVGFGAGWRALALGPRAGVLAPSAPGEAEAAVAIRRARQGGLLPPCWGMWPQWWWQAKSGSRAGVARRAAEELVRLGRACLRFRCGRTSLGGGDMVFSRGFYSGRIDGDGARAAWARRRPGWGWLLGAVVLVLVQSCCARGGRPRASADVGDPDRPVLLGCANSTLA